jgi:anti-anti-sigma regulatory factor
MTSRQPSLLSVAAQFETPPEAMPQPTVLQPKAILGTDGQQFQGALVHALQSAQSVIVDLLWIERLSPEVMQVLLFAMQQAHLHGKSLSFLSMDGATQKQLDEMWVARHSAETGDRHDWFAPEFEHFLVESGAQRPRNLNMMEIASKTRW